MLAFLSIYEVFNLKSLSFPKLPNRLEMIGDLKATFLLNRLLDPKSDLFKLVVIPKVEEVITQNC